MMSSPLEVFIRFRPTAEPQSRVQVEPNKTNMTMTNPVNNEKVNFTFNHIFEAATQEEIFDKVAKQQLDHIFNGYNSCIMASGMTSAGKSFSIVGDSQLNFKTRGLIARSLEHIFNEIQQKPSLKFEVCFSIIEIFNEKIYDLLNNKAVVSTYEENDRVQFKNMRAPAISTVNEGLELLFSAEKSKNVGSTALNSFSSRSHVLYIIKLTQASRLEDVAKSTCSQLFLADLAGSESGQSDAASSHINRSLASLQLCINQLASQAIHIPFRESKLTTALRNALGGNSRTTLLAVIRPDDRFVSESLQTLRFAQRAINIKTDASVQLVSRLFESDGSRQLNSQVATAVAQGLEQNGQLLQAQVLKQLEQENRKLHSEVLILSGNRAQLTASPARAEELKKKLDAWVNDSADLTDIQSRADYEFAMNYLKFKYQNARTIPNIAGAVGSPPQILPQIVDQKASLAAAPDRKDTKTPRDGAREAKGAPPPPPKELDVQGMRETGGYSVPIPAALSGSIQQSPTNAGQLANSGYSSLIATQEVTQNIALSGLIVQDVNGQFEDFKVGPGEAVCRGYRQAREATKLGQDELKSAKTQIQQLAELSQKLKVDLAAIVEKIRSNTFDEPEQEVDPKAKGAKPKEKATKLSEAEQQNIFNLRQNQLKTDAINKMNEFSRQIQQNEAKTVELLALVEKKKEEIDEHKLVEESQRKRLMLNFEAYCAGQNKKGDVNETVEQEALVYAGILNRTTKPRK